MTENEEVNTAGRREVDQDQSAVMTGPVPRGGAASVPASACTLGGDPGQPAGTHPCTALHDDAKRRHAHGPRPILGMSDEYHGHNTTPLMSLLLHHC